MRAGAERFIRSEIQQRYCIERDERQKTETQMTQYFVAIRVLLCNQFISNFICRRQSLT